MHNKLNATEAVGSNLVMGSSFNEGLNATGVYHFECYDKDGNLKWTDEAHNLVTTEGKNAILDKFLGLGTAYANIALGLHTTVGSATSTYASPTPQVESTVYGSTRPTPTFSAASAGSKTTSAAASFSITGTATITGAFLVLGASGVLTAGNTAATAVLFSSGSFSTSRAVVNGDTLNVTYTASV